MNGRLRRLEERTGISPEEEAKHLQYDKRRAEIRAELEAFEARRRAMTEEERKASLEWLKAWRKSPEGQAEARALEAALERRAGGKRWGA